MSLTLFYSPGACSGVTINAIEALGIDCQYLRINLASGEQKSEAYLKINPFGKVPALVNDGQLLTENPAILIYLNSLVPGSKLLPETDDAFQQSLHASDLMWLSSSVHPSLRQVVKPDYFTVSKECDDIVARGRVTLAACFKMAEQRISKSEWWYGDQWSIVDTYLHWCYTRAVKGGFSLADFPILLEHQKRVESQASFKRRMAIESAQ